MAAAQGDYQVLPERRLHRAELPAVADWPATAGANNRPEKDRPEQAEVAPLARSKFGVTSTGQGWTNQQSFREMNALAEEQPRGLP